ncbi:hypothetical protein M427DRAFT_56582 [Gonapodya prolifera JEL478]|uniref:RING-type domain-containing protein n=1 Tax=Gonapodya prolifera (strain JEL478) TaxID=1344416 RepID=A0A139AG36_GONPJ|nr:hypothetical protein M427DRAFT_56582 [Gonapodya prolifera JEL478]|eukprot:KXS15757.1 hypothetical protein M427DRAFT_56582 [Gonapodya prolifera JEL478]
MAELPSGTPRNPSRDINSLTFPCTLAPPTSPVDTLLPPPSISRLSTATRRDSCSSPPRSTSSTSWICLSPLQPGDVLRTLPCTHSFHVRCVDEWLVMQMGWCPLCRLDLSRRALY